MRQTFVVAAAFCGTLLSVYGSVHVEVAPEGPTTAFRHLFETCKGDVDNTTLEVEPLGGSHGIPDWVKATKFNNGFGKFEGPTFKLNYLFDIMAYIVKWRIDGNKVSFSNKFIKSNYYNVAQTKTPTYRTFGGVNPPMNTVQRLETLTHMVSDNLNVNVMKFGNRLVAISDEAGEMELDQENLDTLGLLAFNDTLSSKLAMITCAHPSQLPGDKYIYNYLVKVMGNIKHPGEMNLWQFYRIDTSAGDTLKREVVFEMPIKNGHSPYMHSFAHTENYIVMFEFPLFWEVMKIPLSVNILPDMGWKPENGTVVRVVDKNTWKVVEEYTIEPFFAYHHVNAFEDDATGDIVVDITTVPCANSTGAASCEHMNAFEMRTLVNNSWPIPPNTFKRFTVPIKSGGKTIKSEVLSKTSFDLPHVNPERVGKKYTYVYGNGDHSAGVWWNSLVKVNVETGETLEWYEEDHYATEPNFLPRPGATEEDDGILLSTVLGGGDIQTSYLLVLDAKTMKPLARAKSPHFLPYMSHGFAEPDPL